MVNFIFALIIIAIVGFASLYIYKEKKKGVKCIGCPSSGCGNCKGCKNSMQNNKDN